MVTLPDMDLSGSVVDPLVAIHVHLNANDCNTFFNRSIQPADFQLKTQTAMHHE